MRSILSAFMCGVVFFIAGCNRLPETYAPPAQVIMPAGSDPPASPGNGMLFAMSDPDANTHILGDVYSADSGDEWRFTGLHPKFRFDVRHATHLGFYLRFYNSDDAIRARGPVSFSITINGNHFQSPRIGGTGDLEYRRPIPDGWIATPGRVDVSIDVEPGWHSPDGTTYGILLNSIGFEERQG